MKVDQVTAIVTGGASGIGYAFVKELCSKGGNVIVADVNEQLGKKVCNELQKIFQRKCAIFYHFNVIDYEKYQSLFSFAYKELGKNVNLFVNNAGIIGDSEYFENVKMDWLKVIEIDLLAVIRGTQVAIHHMKENGGIIINTSSMAGLTGVPYAPVYSSAKWGIIGLTRSCEFLNDAYGIRVNAICPTFARTPLLERTMTPEFHDLIQAVGGMVEPELVAQGLIQLVEDDTLTGMAMTITPKKGISFANFASKL